MLFTYLMLLLLKDSPMFRRSVKQPDLPVCRTPASVPSWFSQPNALTANAKKSCVSQLAAAASKPGNLQRLKMLRTVFTESFRARHSWKGILIPLLFHRSQFLRLASSHRTSLASCSFWKSATDQKKANTYNNYV